MLIEAKVLNDQSLPTVTGLTVNSDNSLLAVMDGDDTLNGGLDVDTL